MPSRESELYKDKVEVSLDGRQIFYLFFGGAVIVGIVFVLGVMVGRRVEARGHIERARTHTASDPLAALDRLESNGAVSFRASLTGKEGTTPVEQEIGRRAEARRAEGATKKGETKGEGKSEAKTDTKGESKAEAKAEGKSEAKAEGKSEAKAEGKSEAKAETKAEGTSETGKTETSKSERKTETAKAETAKAETAKAETAKAETAKAETAKTETSKSDRKAETAKSETAKTETAKTEAAKTETAKSEPAKSEPKPEDTRKYTLQLSSFQDKAEAEAFLSSVKSQGYQAQITRAEVEGKGTWYRVRMGSYRSMDDANTAKSDFERVAKKSAAVIKL